MNRPNPMYKTGGLNDEGGEIDEVSGNEVPVGGTKEGVRDDIDVNMSAGEFVSDEATTRYHGLKTFLSMRDEAMMGMQKMEAMGLMGNSDEATLPTDMPFGMGDLMVVQIDKDGEEKELNMQEGGLVDNNVSSTVIVYGPDGTQYSSPQAAIDAGVTNYSMTPPKSSGVVSLESQQQDVPMQDTIGPVTFDEVMSDAKMEFKEYRNAEGQSLMVPFIGGVALYPIPEGYELYTGEDGGDPEVPELPDPAAAITPSRDDDGSNDAALTAYRSSKKDTTINWETLSDDEFIIEANRRNGFGRNLAMGVASLVSPLAAVGMAGLMRVEDNKVLALARSRLAALPQGSAQRAEYEKMIESYEARGKGLFGSIIGKIVDTVGGIFGSTDEQKVKAQNANLVANSGTIVGKYSVNGQITEAGIEALNGGIVEGVTAAEYQKAQQDLNSQDPDTKAAAQQVMSNYIGQELGSFVNKDILDAAKAGLGGRTPEQTRVDLVNIAYQTSDVLKQELDSLTDGQQLFLGYTGKNYLDVIDFGREQTSQLVPSTYATEAPDRTFGNFNKDGTIVPSIDSGLGLSSPQAVTPDVPSTQTFLTNQRDNQVKALINAGVDRSLAEAAIPAASTSFKKPDEFALEGPEALGGATYDPYNVGQLGEFAGMGEQVDVGPSFPRDTFGKVDLQQPYTGDAYQYPTTAPQTVSSFSQAQQEQDINDYATQVYGQVGNLEKADLEAAGYTGNEIQSFMDQNPLVEQQIQTGVGTVGFNQQTADANQKILEQSRQPATIPDVDYADPTLAPTPTTVTPQFDSKTVQDEMAKQEASYMEAAFGDQTSDALQLKDVVPEAKVSFEDAFGAARAEEKRLGIAAGTSQFEYDGKMFSTATKDQDAAKTTKTEEQKGKYSPTANAQLSGGYDTNTLSDEQQTAFDAAVDRGDANVANHFAQVNRSNNKKDEYAASNFDPAVGRSLGLSEFDMEQAEEYGGSIQTAINDGRAEKGDGIFAKVVVTDTSKSKGGSNAGKKDDGGSSTTTKTTTTSSSKDTNIASSGRSETQVQADINKALKDSGGEWTSELNTLVSERDSARSNQGSSSSSSSSSSGGGGGGGGSSSSGGGGCVIATHAVANGSFQWSDKQNALEWCKNTLHDKWWGETMRKGYRYLGRKHIANGTAETVYKEFKECIEWANGKRPFNIKIASRYYYRAAQTFFVGLFVKEDV